VADKATKRQFDPKKAVATKCMGFAQAEGLIVRSLMGDRIAVCPPLIVTEQEIDEIFDRLTRALDRTAEWVRHEGLQAV
jgi:4-aminobutyrate--pyruvate transaminase